MAALVINTTTVNTHKANMIISSLWLPQNFELWLNYLKSGRNEIHQAATRSPSGRTDCLGFELVTQKPPQVEEFHTRRG